jgi:hypothetical protein
VKSYIQVAGAIISLATSLCLLMSAAAAQTRSEGEIVADGTGFKIAKEALCGLPTAVSELAFRMYLNDPKFGSYEKAYLTSTMLRSRAESADLLRDGTYLDCRKARQSWAGDKELVRSVLRGAGWSDQKIGLITGPPGGN